MILLVYEGDANLNRKQYYTIKGELLWQEHIGM